MTLDKALLIFGVFWVMFVLYTLAAVALAKLSGSEIVGWVFSLPGYFLLGFNTPTVAKRLFPREFEK